ncbi:hypothetical protein C7G83_14300 [Siccibacter turicensis]|uniref:Uncharacterized protein n=1 Tax=Siccibacter turicensis TaxID=357233 RepID=A0A2P8VGV1_9ENTR|nr:hypothetical protein C7G83_14300 [Siccibacter turicensis]
MCLSPLIKSVCCWHQRQLISKWCGILLQLLLLCKAPPGVPRHLLRKRYAAASNLPTLSHAASGMAPFQGHRVYTTLAFGCAKFYNFRAAAYTARQLTEVEISHACTGNRNILR